MWNIGLGILFVIGGLSGSMVLRGTNSSGGLAVVGLALIGWGIFQMTEKKGARRPRRTSPAPVRPVNRPRNRE